MLDWTMDDSLEIDFTIGASGREGRNVNIRRLLLAEHDRVDHPHRENEDPLASYLRDSTHALRLKDALIPFLSSARSRIPSYQTIIVR